VGGLWVRERVRLAARAFRETPTNSPSPSLAAGRPGISRQAVGSVAGGSGNGIVLQFNTKLDRRGMDNVAIKNL